MSSTNEVRECTNESYKKKDVHAKAGSWMVFLMNGE